SLARLAGRVKHQLVISQACNTPETGMNRDNIQLAKPIVTANRIIFDVTDLVDFAAERPQLDGIQRVQVEIYRNLKHHPGAVVIPVFFADYPKRYFAADADRLILLDQRYARSLRDFRSAPRKLLRRLDRLRSVKLESGDIVFVAGAGWASQRRTNYLAQ